MTLPEIAKKVKAVAAVPYWSYWLPSLVTLLQLIVLIWMNYQLGTTNVEVTKTATSVEAAHVAINSERKAMQDELKKLHAVILLLTQEKDALKDELRQTGD